MTAPARSVFAEPLAQARGNAQHFYEGTPFGPSDKHAEFCPGCKVDAALDLIEQRATGLQDQVDSLMGMVEWDCSSALRAKAAEQRATDMETALRDLAEHGTRFDTNPTVRWPTSDIHFWWVQRATEMDKAVRDRARAALSAREEAQ